MCSSAMQCTIDSPISKNCLTVEPICSAVKVTRLRDGENNQVRRHTATQAVPQIKCVVQCYAGVAVLVPVAGRSNEAFPTVFALRVVRLLGTLASVRARAVLNRTRLQFVSNRSGGRGKSNGTGITAQATLSRWLLQPRHILLFRTKPLQCWVGDWKDPWYFLGDPPFVVSATTLTKDPETRKIPVRRPGARRY